MDLRLHVVRHAEGIHNPKHDISILDPPLTPKGVQQSEMLSQMFPFSENVGLVITSPLTRTLQTSLIGFQQTLDEKYYPETSGGGQFNGAQLLMSPDIQAHSARPCDTGSDQAILRSEFPHLPWDELVFDPVFPAKEGLYAPDLEALVKRGRRFQRLLEKEFAALANTGRPDIVVVSHGGFMKHFISYERLAFNQAGWMSFSVQFDRDSRMTSMRI
ncbi:phosphoglycerate mutase family protein [Aspergillus ruber CBS 135680]|uniref:Phosphoglycerate mutase-like protein n=1 Tax=Aspergillus ruber (strain CBS 135680) TaxID=1388766 RepID=A0A017S6X9_ASPRC|nr:phosphoglycerate mutase-like protein [Aspergillus ruber CBS 135680]EYE92798.1 phosphoglycerate mutase-like protein [Aspergillus ruber CBS 135680]